jgi:hypothetical protein
MFVTASGRRFVLAYSSLLDWAEEMKSRLVHLGCSPEYAEAVRVEYAEAVPVDYTIAIR